MNTTPNRRILIIDDNGAIHEDFRKILSRGNTQTNALATAEAALFGDAPAPPVQFPEFQIDSAFQGQDGVAFVEKSLEENRPYAMAFIDVRMPPGWDGVETTAKIWQKYPDLQVVICTAYSDYSWEEMLKKIGYSDRLVILKKPFDNIEVLQLAVSMTEKWQLHQQARTHLHELERRVQERTLALQTANGELADTNELLKIATDKTRKMAEAALIASKVKSEFLANMSHEIRTPMNGVLGMINLLVETPLTPEQREYTGTIKTSADSLLSIINDILDFSKIEAGKLALEKVNFDLKTTVMDSVALLAPKAQAKQVALTTSPLDKINGKLVGDPSRLRQILLNLIGNAIKFTDAGEVAVEISQTRETNTLVELRFSVRDTGIGISEEAKEKLFQSFNQAEPSTTRRFGGTGLGLAISRKLVELLGGSIGVNSVYGQGSTFWFTMIFAKQNAVSEIVSLLPPAKTSFRPQSSANQTRVILAEDNKVNQFVGMKQLKKLGYTNVCAVANGIEAVAAWQQNPGSIVLMDCQMPEMDGYEATHKIRELEAQGALPRTLIIAMTANAMQGDRELCLAAGMDDYISKPVEVDQLKQALEKAASSPHGYPETAFPLTPPLTRECESGQGLMA
jgi:two-component system, sensor histidine kinase and response regulator